MFGVAAERATDGGHGIGGIVKVAASRLGLGRGCRQRAVTTE